MEKIKIAIVGIGNCASSLIQGIHYYEGKNEAESIGLMHWDIQGYKPSDIEVVAAFDIDKRKVNKDVNEAIFSQPNCTKIFQSDMPITGVKVRMGIVSDGVSNEMRNYSDDKTFIISDEYEPSEQEIVDTLITSGAEILVNYLPVGSEEATKFYAECALKAGLGFINNIPVFIASEKDWEKRFKEANLPIIGDDIKAQMGATVIHRTLTTLFERRGLSLDRTYQLNTGGNTDFLNMKSNERLSSKKKSKTEAVQSVTYKPLDSDNIHIGPSDYVPWQKDNKVCFIRMEGRMFGEVECNLELRLSVEDSPNSAGIAIDSIRCMKLALQRKIGGVLHAPSSFFCKHPPKQLTDDEAYTATELFINGSENNKSSA